MNLKHLQASITKAASGREADFVCSTDAVDGHGEIVRQNWRLERYLKNPVVLWGHNASDLPIGTARNVRVEGGKLKATIRIASAASNPKADQVWAGIQEGTIKAVSVGFRPGSVKREKHDGEERYVLDDNELFELSIVSIGSNPDALQGRSLVTQARERSELRGSAGLAARALAAATVDSDDMTAEEFAAFTAEAKRRIATGKPSEVNPTTERHRNATRSGEKLNNMILERIK